MPANVFRHRLTFWAALALGHAAGWPGNPCGKVASYPSIWIIMRSPVLPRPIRLLVLPPCPPPRLWSLPKDVPVKSLRPSCGPCFCAAYLTASACVCISPLSPPCVLASAATDGERQRATNLSVAWRGWDWLVDLEQSICWKTSSEAIRSQAQSKQKMGCSSCNRLVGSESP